MKLELTVSEDKKSFIITAKPQFKNNQRENDRVVFSYNGSFQEKGETETSTEGDCKEELTKRSDSGKPIVNVDITITAKLERPTSTNSIFYEDIGEDTGEIFWKK